MPEKTKTVNIPSAAKTQHLPTVQRVEGEPVDIYADIERGLDEFCAKYGIDDLCNISQGRWNGCLLYIYNKYIKDSVNYFWIDNRQKYPDGYDTDILLEVCKYYISLCHLYDKQISIIGFSHLTGVDSDIIMGWGKEKYKKASSTAKVIYKKLMSENEESLQDKLATGKQNPVGVIAILNNIFGWNTSRVSHEVAQSASDNASIASQMGLVLSDNSGTSGIIGDG